MREQGVVCLGHGGGNIINTVWSYRLGNAMFSSATFKRECFPLASMSMPSNTTDRRVSSVLTSRARGYKSSTQHQCYTATTISKTSKCVRRPSNNIAFAISQQKAKRLETAKFESSLKIVCILGEMLRESGVKLAEEMGCRMRGMVKRKLLCSVSHTGFMVEVTQ